MEYEKKYLKLLSHIGENLKLARIKAGLTQEEIAEMANFHVRYYQRLEAGHQSPTLLTLHRVSKCLGIEVLDLLS